MHSTNKAGQKMMNNSQTAIERGIQELQNANKHSHMYNTVVQDVYSPYPDIGSLSKDNRAARGKNFRSLLS